MTENPETTPTPPANEPDVDTLALDLAAIRLEARKQEDARNREEAQKKNTPGAGAVVVGVDGSEQSLEALAWAAAEGGRRNLPVEAVMSYTIPTFVATAMDAGYSALDDETLRSGAETVLREALADLDRRRHENPEVPFAPADRVRAYVETGDAAGTLLEYSQHAEMVVMGARGRGGFFGRILGSVASAVPPHAHCATVVVPKGSLARKETSDTVVVGVDGSTAARLAMLDAAQEAVARGCELKVVWALPPLSGTQMWAASAMDQQSVIQEMNTQLSAAADWLRHHFEGLRVSTAVVEGVPAQVLIEESKRARLLITGTRGRGGFAGMLLGSTSQSVLNHAKCPVLVVPARKDERIENRGEFGPMPEAEEN
ncbi:universal stress protein [Pseudoglutamicibacter cumminsii]|uniref:universal stress protein n=1 Tax=Pseudoglutamicibacter cumminsii TaxID=156979 RepID=UPI002AB89366|nr:universal stress protein [Pseudoglutamicibacter cumminsii]MDZ3744662.1 universal stress protein [Pseudoglutamicibacter cumminsii]